MLFYCLLAVVLLSPLPFGSNRPWSWSLCSLLIAVITLAWVLSFIKNKTALYALKHLNPLAPVFILFTFVMLWASLQSIPNPFLSPHPLWELASEILKKPLPASVSLTPVDSVTSMMRLLSYALVFLLSFYYCQVRQNAKRVFFSLMLTGCFYSLYGLVIYFGDYQLILWFKSPSSANAVNSTFINHNHFVTYIGLTLLVTLALLNQAFIRALKYHIGGNIGRQRFLEHLAIEAWIPLLCSLFIATALVLTYSRGGFLSAIVGLAVLLGCLNINKQARNQYLFKGSLWLIVMILGIFYLSSDNLVSKIERVGLYDKQRAEVFALTWEAITSNPLTGFGLGSFEEVFPMYKSLELMGGSFRHPMLWDYAHNSYLETLFELGIPAALALFACFFYITYLCFKGLFIRKRDWFYPATGVAATALVATHASVDFSLQIPAVTYTYCLLMGTACAQSFASAKH